MRKLGGGGNSLLVDDVMVAMHGDYDCDYGFGGAMVVAVVVAMVMAMVAM